MELKKKEYSLEEAVAIYMGKAKDLAKEAMEKSEKMSPEEAAKKIKGEHKVNEILPKVAPEDRKEVFKELKKEGMEKTLAKRPLELKKFMEKCAMKKSGWKQHPGPSEKTWAPTKKQPEPTEKERKTINEKALQEMKDKKKEVK